MSDITPDEIIAWMAGHIATDYASEPVQPTVNKAGIIPLIEVSGVTKILLVKPQAKKKHLGPPAWQLIKGTRMIKEKNDWRDVDPDKSIEPDALEPLLCTALREGMEEAGLKLGNIASMGPLGLFHYRSLSSGKEKTMQLYALLMSSETDFFWPKADHPVTQDMQWFDLSALPEDTRKDAAEIIQQVATQL